MNFLSTRERYKSRFAADKIIFLKIRSKNILQSFPSFSEEEPAVKTPLATSLVVQQNCMQSKRLSRWWCSSSKTACSLQSKRSGLGLWNQVGKSQNLWGFVVGHVKCSLFCNFPPFLTHWFHRPIVVGGRSRQAAAAALTPQAIPTGIPER